MKTWQWLGYLGLTPFIFCLSLYQYYPDINLINPQQVFVFYSAIILSFISGSLWRTDKINAHCKDKVISNIFCLYAFINLLLPIVYSLLLLPLGYLGLLLAEYLLDKGKHNAFNRPYFSMRIVLTLSVVLLHGWAFILWY